MITAEVNQRYKDAAEKSLAMRFDPEAFIVLSLALQNEKQLGEPVDIIPDSSIDESTAEFIREFKKYHDEKKLGKGSTEQLRKTLKIIKRIATEIYYSCTEQEKAVYAEILGKVLTVK